MKTSLPPKTHSQRQIQHRLSLDRGLHPRLAQEGQIPTAEISEGLGSKFLLVAGMSTSFNHCSGKHSRNSSSSSISRIFAQELCFQVPLLFLNLGSALLGQVVGVTHEPRTGTVVFGVGCAFSGTGSLSSSTSPARTSR